MAPEDRLKGTKAIDLKSNLVLVCPMKSSKHITMLQKSKLGELVETKAKRGTDYD